MSLPHPHSLLPQRAPAAFLDRIVWSRPGEILCEATLGSSFPYLRGGRAESFVGIEFVAQAASLVATLARDGEGGPSGRVGYVVLVSEAEFFVDRLPIGEVLSVIARETWSDSVRASYEGEVVAAGERLLWVSFSVMEREA